MTARLVPERAAPASRAAADTVRLTMAVAAAAGSRLLLGDSAVGADEVGAAVDTVSPVVEADDDGGPRLHNPPQREADEFFQLSLICHIF